MKVSARATLLGVWMLVVGAWAHPVASAGECSEPPPDASPSGISRTDHQVSGNRIASGCGPLSAEPIDVALPGEPAWVIADPTAPGDGWLVALIDGAVVRVSAASASVDRDPVATLPADAPPEASVDEGGVLTIRNALDAATAFDDSVPDARVVVAEDGSQVALVGPTEQYPHGALGDMIEASSVEVHRPDGMWERTIFGETEVIEGLSPLIADLDADGSEEVVVTVSDMYEGARLVASATDRTTATAYSEPIGQGFRWLHQIGAGPTGPDGEVEIIAVRTPHIGGIVEAYRLEDGRLKRVATRPGYSSHQNGSTNLDMALLADADGDGRLDLVVPTEDMRSLAVLTRVDDGFEEIDQRSLDGRLSTNVGAVVDAAGQLSLAVGTDAGSLRIFR